MDGTLGRLQAIEMMTRQMFEVDSWGETHAGRVRELNEDRFLLEADSGVFVVADGMGGHDAGEVASSAIVDHLRSVGRPSSAPDLRARFENRVARANAEIRALSASRNGATIGSTMAALLAFERQYACIWAGDSRVYLMREGELAQVTRDHTEVQDLLDRGLLTPEEAATWPRRNVITRAIGVLDEPPLDIAQGQIQTGDRFMICSDGLTAHVSDQEIGEILYRYPPRDACRELIERTLAGGATDNVTVIVVEFRDERVISASGDHWTN